jgi:hypothetical protein
LRRPKIDAYVILIGAILVVGLYIRAHDLNRIQQFVDEYWSIDSVVQLRDDPNLQLLKPYQGVAAFTRVYTYLQATTVDLYGANFTGLRLVSAILGTLTIGALYFLTQTVFDKRTALLAALLLATFPPHVHFSRIGLNNTADPLFGTLALAFVARGVLRMNAEDERLTDFALAGAALGLTQYFYEGGRLLYPPLVIAFMIIAGGRMISRQAWLIFVGVALAVSAPVYLTLIVGGYPLAPRLESEASSMLSLSRVVSNGPVTTVENTVRALVDPFWFYVQKSDQSWFYGGKTALILPLVLPFFLMGVVYVLWRVRGKNPREVTGARLIVLWLVAVAVGNSLLALRLESPRYVVVFPALALTVAVGIRYSAPLLFELRGRQNVVMAVAGIGLAIVQVNYYFGTHVPEYIQASPEIAYIDDARIRAADLPDDTHVHIISDTSTFLTDSVAYLKFRDRWDDGVFIEVMSPQDFNNDYMQSLLSARNYAFFVSPDSQTIINRLQTFFGDKLPEPQISSIESPLDGYYLMYLVRRGWDR